MSADRPKRPRIVRRRRRPGYLYVAVLSISAGWRTSKTNGAFSSWVVLSDDGVNSSDAARVRHRLTDNDGDLGDDSSDAVEVTAHAVVGKSEVAVTATLAPQFAPQPILAYGVTAYDDIQIESGGTLTSEYPIQVGDDCKTNSRGLLTTSTLECNGRVEMTFRGDRQSAAVKMPTHDVVDKYVQVGTQIPVASLPVQNGRRVIEDIVLSAAANPFGTADAAGIYWIDASYQIVRIANCRIAATLAIKNAASIEVTGGMVWTYARQPEAILVADADISFGNIEPLLDEAARNINFNPMSSPYRQTLANSTSTDLFPSELKGVIFTTDDITFDPTVDGKPLVVTGAVVCKDLWIDGFVAVRQLSEVIDSPPLGLIDEVPMQFVRGTFRRVPTP